MTGTDLTATPEEAPALVREDSLAPAAVAARMRYSQALAQSDLVPEAYRGRPANVLVAVEYGSALGIRPIAALAGINVIKGKPTMSADLMASVVRQAGHRLRVSQDGMRVTARLIRRDDPDFTYSVTWDQERAQRAGLWGQRGPWSQYPEQMLRSRAITEVCRQGASECLYGAIYAPEELADADPFPEGQAGSRTEATAQPTPAEQATSGRERLVAEWLTAHGYDSSPATVQRLVTEAEAAGTDPTPDAYRAWLDAQLAASASSTGDAGGEAVDAEDTTIDGMDGAEIIGEEAAS